MLQADAAACLQESRPALQCGSHDAVLAAACSQGVRHIAVQLVVAAMPV
jgi:hypothetical protein